MKYLSIAFMLIWFSSKAQLPVIVHETFDKNTYGWAERESDRHKLLFRDGKYYLEAAEEGWMSCVEPYMDLSKDFSIQATFTQVDGLEDNGIGLIWGYDGKDPVKMNNFTFSTNGSWRIWNGDRSIDISNDWHTTDLVNPLGRENIMKVEQRAGVLYFYLNGKVVTSHKALTCFGKYLGFIAYTKMTLLIDDFILAHDIEIRLPSTDHTETQKVNLGPLVNSKYHEVGPKVTADGKILYFVRQNSPQNVGGSEDKEDIWFAKRTPEGKWSRALNIGPPVNTSAANNLLGVSTDNNTLLFHTPKGFGVMHRTTKGWTSIEDLGISFKNESPWLEGSLAPDGKAIIFAAKFKSNVNYRQGVEERDIYVCEKLKDGTWSAPVHTGAVLNTSGDEYSPFLSADGKTLYFGTNGRPGYGNVDVFMSRRLGEGWQHWSEPTNLGLGINTVGFDAYYTIPASGDQGYMVSSINTYGHVDIVSFKLPKNLKPDPVVLVTGKVLNSKTKAPLEAVIRFDDLKTQNEVGEARSDPATGDYRIALPQGKNYGYHAAAPGYLSVNENLELVSLTAYDELKKDLYLVPIEVGESIQLRNVFFVQSKAELKPESYPELDRLVAILKENPTMEIELQGHTDMLGNADANLKLSTQRVEAVKAYLVEKGIFANRITGKGFGGSKPVAPSDTEANRQLNRRVEFKVTKT